MAVGYGSSSSTGANDQLVSTINVPVPAGVVAGNHVYVALEQWEAGNPTVTAPSGFVAFTPVVSGSQKLKVFVKEATGSDTGNYTFSWTGSQWTLGHAVRVTGAKAGNPTGANFNSASVASGTAIPNTSVTVGFVPGLLQWSCNENSATQTTPPTNFTEVQDSNYLHSNYRMNAAASGTFTAPSGVLSASTLILAFLAAIEPAGGASTVNGTADAPFGALAASAAGVKTVAGTAAAVLGSLAATANGGVLVAGTAAAPLGGLSAAASGALIQAGTAAAPLGSLAAAAAGTTSRIGTATALFGALAATAAGTRTVTAAAAAALGGLSAAAAGMPTVIGSAVAPLGALAAAASGVVTGAGSGVGDAQLGALVAAAAGVPTVTAAAVAVFGVLTAQAAAQAADASAAAVLGGVVSSAAGVPVVAAAAAALLGGLTATAAGGTFASGTAVALLGALVAGATSSSGTPIPVPADRVLVVPARQSSFSSPVYPRSFTVPQRDQGWEVP